MRKLSNKIVIAGKIEVIKAHPLYENRMKLYLTQSLDKGFIERTDELRNVFVVIVDVNSLSELDELIINSYVRITGELESMYDLFLNGTSDEFAIKVTKIERID